MMTKIGLTYDCLKYAVFGMLCLLIAGFVTLCLLDDRPPISSKDTIQALPNHNYIPDIRNLHEQGKLSEALELSRFVLRHPDLPGQDEARVLEQEIDAELKSLWSRTKRAASGFASGDGHSIEELGGAIASDMIVYGDIRDLFKQGFYKVTGRETDIVVASLAGVGLLTEAFDAVDWAPAVLKAFRKIGSLSGRFADWLVSSCKRSVRTRKIDGALKTSFADLRQLVDSIGLGRTSSIFKHIETPSELSSIRAMAARNADAAYFTVKNGDREGVKLVERFAGSEAGVRVLADAAKKGPGGLAWLKQHGVAHAYAVRVRVGARLLKNLRLHRPQRLIAEVSKQYPLLRNALWCAALLAGLVGTGCFVEAGRKVAALRVFPVRKP